MAKLKASTRPKRPAARRHAAKSKTRTAKAAKAVKAVPPRRLKLAEVRRAFRIIGQVRALGADPGRWRKYMVRRLKRLLDADMVISSELSFLSPPQARPADAKLPRGALKGAILRDRGFGILEDGRTWEIDEEHPEFRPEDYQVLLAGRVSPDGHLSVRPRQQVRVGQFFLLSQVSLPHADTVDQLGIYRFDAKRPFGGAQVRLLRLVHTELGRLWRAQAMKKARDPRIDLPPRLVQTLALLADGAGEKQVARELGISPHTVHNYVKALHQRFNVSSRGELLARLREATDRTDYRPRLSVELPR